ncbi:SPX domain-containing protein 1 [Phytophthora cinnamomi]|uniref:SPX domain-containing protein 1 n=1 Tax=Phytophthora cinnamomi TaxID=4785 RepID=UPI00355ABAA3|nr:SPX domain-containing protein 1 [Phytophthora cinnamomi]
MKFGKGLLQEILQSNPEWAPFWLNYKILKKRIKAVTRAAHHAANQRDISESELEVAFFRDLQAELKKISLFYAAEEKRCSFRYHQLRSVLKTLKKREKVEAVEAQRLMFAFVHFYRECIRLENFAVMNYQGFSKILKKHDKMTGYNTRSKYMRRKVNLSSFSNYPSLLQILASTEEMFHEVERDARMASAVSSIKLNIEPQVTPDASSTRALAPVVHIPSTTSVSPGSSSTPVGTTASVPPKFLSPHLTPSNSSAAAASFPASVLWASEEQKFQL